MRCVAKGEELKISLKNEGRKRARTNKQERIGTLWSPMWIMDELTQPPRLLRSVRRRLHPVQALAGVAQVVSDRL